MEIAKPTSHKPIPVASAKAMPNPGEPGGPVLLEDSEERVKEARAKFDAMMAMANDTEARDRQLALQRQIKAHTVFTVGGKVVALQESNGWSLFKENRFGDMGVFNGEPSHLRGRALADHRAQAMEAALRSVYGDALVVHDYADDPNAPTHGQLEPALWEGKTLEEVLSQRAGTRKGPNPLLALTGGAMSVLHGGRV